MYTLRRRNGGECSTRPPILHLPSRSLLSSAYACFLPTHSHTYIHSTATPLPLLLLRCWDGFLKIRLLDAVKHILIEADPKPERRRFQDRLVQEIKRGGKDKASAGDVIVLLCNFIDAKYASDTRTGTKIRNFEGFLQSLLGRFLKMGFAPGHYEGFPNGAPSWRGR